MSELYKRNPNINCFICGNAIYKRPAEIEKNEGRVFCSQACYGISCRKEKNCVVCGKSILAGLNKKTCSRICANKNRKGIKYGTKRVKDKVSSYKSLKLRLLNERDKKCERCGYGEFQILQIHHKDRNRNNNDLDNLELICPNCHTKEHFLENSWLNDRVFNN